MIIEEKFNKRAAPLIDVGAPWVAHGNHSCPKGIGVTFHEPHTGPNTGRNLTLHMTPEEALTFGRMLLEVAQRQIFPPKR